MKLKAFVAAAAAGAALIAVGIGWAAIPDTSGVIHVCYKTTDATRLGGSALSVIDSAVAGATCKPGESELTFNQQGPIGPQGLPGGVVTTLPSGQSESGVWGAAESTSGFVAPITFPIPLAAGLPLSALHFMAGATSSSCPGVGHAAAGQLCVYGGNPDLPFAGFIDPTGGGGAAAYGVDMLFFSGTSTASSAGSWTATAP